MSTPRRGGRRYRPPGTAPVNQTPATPETGVAEFCQFLLPCQLLLPSGFAQGDPVDPRCSVGVKYTHCTPEISNIDIIIMQYQSRANHIKKCYFISLVAYLICWHIALINDAESHYFAAPCTL